MERREERLVTLRRFFYPIEAELSLGRLKAEGVPAYLQDSNTVNINWLYSFALGGIRLQVPAEWEGKARLILGEEPSEILDERFTDGTPPR